MNYNENVLSGRIAEQIVEMISIEKRFAPGDKLPNEIELSQELGVSRTTLREAVRILVTRGLLEIHRGRGTFVTQNRRLEESINLSHMTDVWVNIKDLYEIRLIFEPQAAYYAAQRASAKELEIILELGRRDEEKMKAGLENIEEEMAFHNAIARATHNEFMHRLMPILNRGIYKGVRLSGVTPGTITDTIQEHRYIMEFLKARNAAGARAAMQLHIINTLKSFGIEME